MPRDPGRGRPRRYCSRACQARAYRRRRDHVAAGRRREPAGRPATTATTVREGLVELAIRTADAAGLGAVAMRTLAERAGLPVHALYQAVHDRAELLAAMAERTIGDRMPQRPAPADPRAALDQLARDEWAMYRRHPWLVTILATGRPPTGPAVLSIVDRAVEALTLAGYSPADAFAGYLALDGYVQGMALLVDRETADTTYHTWRTATLHRLERTGRVQRHPWLAAVRHSDPRRAARELDTWFDFGLRRLLDGLLPALP
ncbi:hypothetical protein BU204_23690 [Actinophytocola xanthii]|uniref:HTH tetR-type domain-containing protein n=1 Tax=Actinophytocola xanthii TaxID=1912961 RepID=A0A1Q8CLA7_9PSEU|nr:hypothetical protein BU204_23690 [Actinophytocola xanthii]